MNILIINGSPRKKGLISQMLGIMQEEAETRGDTVEMVYTNGLTVKPCTGCMACRTKEKCVLAEDDSQRVLKMMQKADAIIMGAPCYWGNIPGQMKLMFDRQVSAPALRHGLGTFCSNSRAELSVPCVR